MQSHLCVKWVDCTKRLLLVIGYWTILQLHNHVEGLDTNLTHHVSFPLSNPVTSGLKGVLNIQNTYRASRGKGIGLMHLCYVANSVSSSMFTFPSLKLAMSMYANIFRFWTLMPVYIIFSKSWHDDNDNDGHMVTTLSLYYISFCAVIMLSNLLLCRICL